MDHVQWGGEGVMVVEKDERQTNTQGSPKRENESP